MLCGIIRVFAEAKLTVLNAVIIFTKEALTIRIVTFLLCIFASALIGCATQTPAAQAFSATVAPTQTSVPVASFTPLPTERPQASNTPTLVVTPSATFKPLLTNTPAPTETPTPSLTPTPSYTPTQALWTLTPAARQGAPASYQQPTAEIAATAGWSCMDFPCENDIAGFLRKIRVPAGYAVEHVGKFPGQPVQIAYGLDARLYATIIDDPASRTGAVYALDEQGAVERYSGTLISPIGLAFQPGTDVLYVSARASERNGGGIWQIPSGGGEPIPVIRDLPCCYSLIDNQPNGMVFGMDGYLYIGVGALTDHGEPPNPRIANMAELHPYEASILRIQPHTGSVEVYASGLRNPYDIAFDSLGQFYATDQGLVSGQGDRVVAVERGGHYGWPFWGGRGCEGCPPKLAGVTVSDDLFTFPDMSIPRGVVAYTGTQFPENMFDTLFVVLWNGGEQAQRVVHLDPRNLPQATDEIPRPFAEPFITGLIRPIDIALAPDGSLVVADFIYGHVWRVRYTR